MQPTDAPDLPGGGKPPEPGPGHEESDVSIRGIVRFGIGLAVAAAVIHVAMWGLFRLLDARESREERPVPPLVAAGLARTPPGPRLEPDPLAPRRAMQAREDVLLRTYGWVDRGSGTVRIPVERAMELLVERGLPPAKPMAPVTPGPEAGSRKPVAGSREPEAGSRKPEAKAP
jgi:hypothetical protein